MKAVSQVIILDTSRSPSVGNIIRRVCEDHIGLPSLKQGWIRFRSSRVAAQYTMQAQYPNIPERRYRLNLHIRNSVIIRLAPYRDFFPREKLFKFCFIKSGERHGKFILTQGLKFNPQQFIIPYRVDGELIICNDIGTLLRFTEMGQLDNRDLR